MLELPWNARIFFIAGVSNLTQCTFAPFISFFVFQCEEANECLCSRKAIIADIDRYDLTSGRRLVCCQKKIFNDKKVATKFHNLQAVYAYKRFIYLQESGCISLSKYIIKNKTKTLRN